MPTRKARRKRGDQVQSSAPTPKALAQCSAPTPKAPAQSSAPTLKAQAQGKKETEPSKARALLKATLQTDVDFIKSMREYYEKTQCELPRYQNLLHFEFD